MRRLLPLALALLAACGGSSGGGGAGPRKASPVPDGTPPGVTAFAQTVPAEDALGEIFPGQANSWVLDRDLSLAQGYGLQYRTALALWLGAPTSPATHASLTDDILGGVLDFFPGDQDVAELTFLTPFFSAAEGVRTAAVSDGLSMGVPALSGARSGYLNGTASSRLSREVTLAAGTSYTLSWIDRGALRAGNLLGATAAPHAPSYRVVLRDRGSDAILHELFSASTDFGSAAPLAHGVPIPSGISGPVRLSFELRSAAGGFAAVDDVVLADQAGPVPGFTGGDFEASAALGPWAASSGAEIQNVRSGARDVVLPSGTLTVTRTFHAPPAASWARLVDVFENPSSAAISTTAVYLTSLAGTAPLAAVRSSGRAVVGWDANHEARDVAVVLGSGAVHLAGGSGDVYVVHPLTVPARGRVALVHFVVQLGRTEGGSSASAVPAGVDGQAAAVAAGFPAAAEYASDLEPGVQDLVSNF